MHTLAPYSIVRRARSHRWYFQTPGGELSEGYATEDEAREASQQARTVETMLDDGWHVQRHDNATGCAHLIRVNGPDDVQLAVVDAVGHATHY